MSIKAVFVDFDYTIYSHKKQQIPPSAVKALNSLHDMGVKVILSTGRSIPEMGILSEYKEISFDGYVLLNGQLCLDENLNTLYENPFHGKTLKALINLFNSKTIPMSFVEKDDVYINFASDAIKKACGDLKILDHRISEYTGNPLFLAVCYDIRLEDEKMLNDKIPDICFQRWSPLGVDVVSKGCDKAKGIEFFSNLYGLKKEETMAIGDSLNDMKMIQFAGIGVAMGNAVDSVKDVADFVTKDIDEDGIEFALRHFSLI